VLELWFDFSCPYAYLASRRALTLGVPIDWRPMLLGGVFRGIGAGDGPMATNGPAKALHNVADMHRWAQAWDAPFQLPAAHPMRSVRALRVLLALPHSRWPAAIEAIYAAYWQRAEDITSDGVIAQALRLAGLSGDDITHAMTRAETPAIKDELRERTDEAISLGIFGAPGWVLRRPAPLLIWGQDRMPWVAAAIAGWDPETGPPPGGPRPFASPERALPGATVDVYLDVASPFAYLALTQLGALAAMGATVRLVPILLGALFRDIGQVDVPLFAMPAAKAAYINLDMQRWARWWGVPFEAPAKFPQRTVTAQRLILLAADRGFEVGHRLAIALGRAMWAEHRDLEDAATLRAIVESVGLEASLVERTQDPAIKARLAANTAAARAANVFGVPTFVINGKQVFWGQDRLDHVAKTLAGWDAWQPR
jgi:2-hydroxychromene-2-carboxylate isomerase